MSRLSCASSKTELSDAEAEGEPVLFLHGSASSARMWRAAAQVLPPLYRAVAPDLIGYGGSTAWPADAPFDIEAEARALEPLLPCCGDKFHLVGHSYGGVVALRLALASPIRVRTLTLIEPVLFSVLRHAGETAAFERMVRLRDAFVAKLAAGESDGGMQAFVDFWGGDGAWASQPDPARAAMVKIADKIVLDFQVAFGFEPAWDELAQFGPRTVLLRGDRSPEPMQRLVDALHRLMPLSQRIVVPGANHLLPSTHGLALIDAVMAQLNADAERTLR
jgi:pimeloyl-ACP methyl ester carboxylesterase